MSVEAIAREQPSAKYGSGYQAYNHQRRDDGMKRRRLMTMRLLFYLESARSLK